ncbi:hypothetical protein RHOSPDRAFT_24919 [Rhodotorula sp. JG-1b]|nr:hypothetical protein RHOSPDRAFT_24919 [Rhodotorula sp. JG-1b]
MQDDQRRLFDVDRSVTLDPESRSSIRSMASNAHKWGRPKAGPVGPTATLSLEQQQILAAVPRYKKAWVRPASLKPGQNPNFKICKWVIDTDLDKSEGTEEEMREALEQVTAGNVPLPATETEAAPMAGGAAAAAMAAGGTAGPSGSTVSSALPTGAAPTPSTTTASGTPTSGGTPAPSAPAAAPGAPAAVPSSTLATSANPIAQVQGTDPAKPAEGPAPDGTAPSVQEAVKGLEDVEMASMTDAGPAVNAEAKSLVQEDQVAPQP